MAGLKGLHVVVPAELLDATYDKAASEGKSLSEAVTDLLARYTRPQAVYACDHTGEQCPTPRECRAAYEAEVSAQPRPARKRAALKKAPPG